MVCGDTTTDTVMALAALFAAAAPSWDSILGLKEEFHPHPRDVLGSLCGACAPAHSITFAPTLT